MFGSSQCPYRLRTVSPGHEPSPGAFCTQKEVLQASWRPAPRPVQGQSPRQESQSATFATLADFWRQFELPRADDELEMRFEGPAALLWVLWLLSDTRNAEIGQFLGTLESSQCPYRLRTVSPGHEPSPGAFCTQKEVLQASWRPAPRPVQGQSPRQESQSATFATLADFWRQFELPRADDELEMRFEGPAALLWVLWLLSDTRNAEIGQFLGTLVGVR